MLIIIIITQHAFISCLVVPISIVELVSQDPLRLSDSMCLPHGRGVLTLFLPPLPPPTYPHHHCKTQNTHALPCARACATLQCHAEPAPLIPNHTCRDQHRAVVCVVLTTGGFFCSVTHACRRPAFSHHAHGFHARTYTTL